MRIAIDIDSTLHHYWPELAAAAGRRFGVDLPYEDQDTWEIPALAPEQLRTAIADTHSDAAIARAQPYAHAVETVNAWKDAGHFIQVTSHRAQTCHPATKRWLDDIGLRYDELHCSYDKLARCLELGIDLLIDDSPDTLARAGEHGLHAATLAHPWNRDLCRTRNDIVCARDWPALAEALERRFALTRRAA
jgi:uncharacterized protein